MAHACHIAAKYICVNDFRDVDYGWTDKPTSVFDTTHYRISANDGTAKDSASVCILLVSARNSMALYDNVYDSDLNKNEHPALFAAMRLAEKSCVKVVWRRPIAVNFDGTGKELMFVFLSS